MSEKLQEIEGLNKDAKEYIPTKNRIPKIIDFNLTNNCKPKEIIEYIEADDDEDDEEEVDEDVKEKMDIIVKDMVEADIIEEMGDESEDEDKWFPKYKDCECCNGFVFKCKGETCADLGQCYCKMKDDCDKQAEKSIK